MQHCAQHLQPNIVQYIEIYLLHDQSLGSVVECQDSGEQENVGVHEERKKRR
jgi:hypothetical protein